MVFVLTPFNNKMTLNWIYGDEVCCLNCGTQCIWRTCMFLSHCKTTQAVRRSNLIINSFITVKQFSSALHKKAWTIKADHLSHVELFSLINSLSVWDQTRWLSIFLWSRQFNGGSASLSMLILLQSLRSGIFSSRSYWSAIVARPYSNSILTAQKDCWFG